LQSAATHGRLPKLLNGRLTIILVFIILCLITAHPARAQTWDYTINSVDTPGTVDNSTTSAEVDTTNNEIRLPHVKTPDVISFWGSGEMDYVVLTTDGVHHYSFNGTNMVENSILNISATNPLAMAAPDPYPDTVVADSTGILHYSFSGSEMLQNPAMSVAGLTGVTATGAAGTGEVATLSGNHVEHYSFSGSSMARNAVLEPSVTLTNPIDVALGSGGYDTAVLEPDRIRWFNFSGIGTIENPALAVSGLTAPKAFAVADPNGGYDVAVIDGTDVKHYSFNGTNMVYNAALSITSGLTAPSAIALRPGSYDRLIVDGSNVKYYQWDGAALVYNSNLSVTVANIAKCDNYVASAVVQSLAFDPGMDSCNVRVRAVHELPNNTSVTWSVTADGTNWVKKWRVLGTATGSVCELSTDNGLSWSSIGDASVAEPSSTITQLWAQVTPGREVKWKAELATTDTSVTPKIATTPRGNVAVRLDSNSAPDQPVLPVYGSCFATTTPTLSWTFSDADAGDSQSAYQVQVVRASDMAVVIDSGQVTSNQSYYTVPTSMAPDTPGPLWNSGEYQFRYRVMVWDSAGAASIWSDYSDFCIVAYERPRVAQIISPPAGQTSPDPSSPATHIVVTPGMTQGQLPRVKAGAKVVLLVDSIGPIITFTPSFPYLSKTATINVTDTQPDGFTGNPLYSLGNTVNRWSVEFWTDASLEECPNGTVVKLQLSGSSTEGATLLNAPPYSDGVVVTEGSIYSSWSVVLQGRDT